MAQLAQLQETFCEQVPGLVAVRLVMLWAARMWAFLKGTFLAQRVTSEAGKQHVCGTSGLLKQKAGTGLVGNGEKEQKWLHSDLGAIAGITPANPQGRFSMGQLRHTGGELNPCFLMPGLPPKWEWDQHSYHPGAYFKVEGCTLHVMRGHLYVR